MCRILCYGEVEITDKRYVKIAKVILEKNGRGKFFFIVSELYGLNLEKYIVQGLTNEHILQVGHQVVSQLEVIHKAGMVHCDIKPDNILIGQGRECDDRTKRVRLIDFGLSHDYLDDQGVHIKYSKTNFKGSINFSSLNAMDRSVQTRRDDFLALCYNLLYLL
jgi:serine/threonine protein kinase